MVTILSTMYAKVRNSIRLFSPLSSIVFILVANDTLEQKCPVLLMQ